MASTPAATGLTVLVVSSEDLRPDLSKTVLGRSEVEYVLAVDGEAGLAAARSHRPRLAIVALDDQDAALGFVRRIREDPLARHVSLLVRLPSLLPPGEEALRRAGASAVLGGRVDPFLWNAPLERLMGVARRRAASIPVRFWVWFRTSEDEEPARGLALNVSTRGMLIEAAQPTDVEIGTRVEIEFTLPAGRRKLSATGRVVRQAGDNAGLQRFGVEFLDLPSDVAERIEGFAEAEAEREPQ